MSLPFYKFVPITGSVVAPAFTTEKNTPFWQRPIR